MLNGENNLGPSLASPCGWISCDGGLTWCGGQALDTSSYGYPGGFVMEDDSIFISYCASAQPPNRVYAMKVRVEETRKGMEVMKI